MADVLLIQTSSFSVKLRPARPDEANQVAALVEHAYVKYVERMGRRPGPMDDDYEAQIAAGRVTVAESDGEIVGILVLVEEPDCLLVENVAVEPSAQGEGLGRALLAHAEEVARASGLSRLRLYTHSTMTENRALYPRLGYVEVDPPADDEWNRIFFVKQTRRAEPMKSAELSGLPPDLPVPVDDGAVEHLKGMAVPSLELAATSGRRWTSRSSPGRSSYTSSR